MLPRRVLTHRGSEFTELDVEAVLARAPQVAMIDELAHTNVPGSLHQKRWQDVHDLLDAGIDVVTTVNVQHLESLNDDVEAITGVKQRETVPDHVVRDADQIQLVDLLRRHCAGGSRTATSTGPSRSTPRSPSTSGSGNLTALRELALLWLADRVDDALTTYRREHRIESPWPARERVVVAVTGGAEGDTLLRRGARIAQRAAGSELLAVHVLATDGLPSAPPATIAEQRRLVESLGGTFHTVVGEDVPTAVVDFARGVNATMIVVGVSRRSRWREAVRESNGTEIARLAGMIDVHLVTHERARSGRRHARSDVRAVASPPGRWLGARSRRTRAAHRRAQRAARRRQPAHRPDALPRAHRPGRAGRRTVAGHRQRRRRLPPAQLVLHAADRPADDRRAGERARPRRVRAGRSGVASVVDLAARRTTEAFRARAEASALAAVSRSVLSGEDTAAALVARLRETFTLEAVALLAKNGSAGTSWRPTAPIPLSTPRPRSRPGRRRGARAHPERSRPARERPPRARGLRLAGRHRARAGTAACPGRAGTDPR